MCRITKNSGIILIICLILQSSALSTDFAGGTGEPNDPYQIATANDLMLLGESPEYYDKHFILINDIDLDPNLPGRKILKKAVIASETYDPSRGGFNGTSFIGFFDGNGHTISHLTITGDGYLGLFRQLGTGAKISNLGLVAVDIDGSDHCLGGLVAENDHGSIVSCYSTGKVSGNYKVGGLVGANTGSITSSYSTCVVKGSDHVGGLVGENDGNIASSYSTGPVSGNWNTGGLAGDDLFGHTISSFWDVDTSGQTTSAGGTGLTTSEMQNISTFLNGGWDVVGENLNGTCDYWQISPGYYPQLRSPSGDNPTMMEGLGTAQQPFLIQNAQDLGTVWIKPMAHYRLAASVDLSEITWSMAVVPWFGGTFDGNGHVIRNLHIQGGEYLGLFGQLGSGAIISNLGLEAIDVNGTDSYVGGLAGYNYKGRIVTSFSTGTISGDYVVGGLVGRNVGSITLSYSTCMLIGKGRVGGLVGENNGNITMSYCTGKVINKTTGVIRYTGGLVGANDYGDITLSFWDVETSGQVTSDGGTGLTTNEMLDINTFLNAGWDFVGEKFNGTCDYWQISPGDYPQLRIHSGDRPVMPEGLGTAQQPYLIRDTQDLGTVWFKPMAYYRLETSVDLSEITWSIAVIPWFGGSFDGNGHVIGNLHIQGSEYLGLFGQLASGAMISNLGLDTVDINGTDDYIGGLVGYNYKGRIVTCFSTGTINGDCYVGGLVGNSEYGSITSCYSNGIIIGDVNAGGLVGHNWYGNIDTSFSTVTISGNDNIGGLVGQTWHGSIDTSFSTGTVSGDDNVGGLVGDNSANITNSYSTCTVNGDEYVGGLVGENYLSSIISSYSTGTIDGNSSVGGLVGLNSGSITACYSNCVVNGYSYVGGLAGRNEGNIAISYSNGKVKGIGWDAGGLVGYNYYGGITSSFWDMETSGQVASDGGTGLTTVEMQDITIFLNAGWDIVDENFNGTCDYWQISSGDYPRLRSHSSDRPEMPEGLGTTQQPYLIRDARDLGTLWCRPMAHYRLETSVDLSEITWPTAVVPWFGGTFDGNGYLISNLHIQGGEFQGLFGQLGPGALISNLGLDDVDVNGSADYVGGLVGYNYKGSITTSSSTGTVNGENYIGGLVGNSDHGKITSSDSAGTINGHDHVGGLVGSNRYGSIDTSSSTSTISGDDDIGGLIGSNYEGSIISSYSTGTVSGDDNVGGLSGYNEYGSISSSYSTGLVTGIGEKVGGLVGCNNGLSYAYQGLIITSYSTGAVSGDKNVGGLVGENYYSSIASSYSTGRVKGNQCVGGLVGLNRRGYITMSYSTGAVKGDSETGGLTGSGGLSSSQSHGTAICFWDTQTSGQTTSSAGTGKTTAEMQTASTFIEAGWDFVDETENGTEDIWWILEGRDYPRLWWELIEDEAVVIPEG
jgi:hypothetical protein